MNFFDNTITEDTLIKYHIECMDGEERGIYKHSDRRKIAEAYGIKRYNAEVAFELGRKLLRDFAKSKSDQLMGLCIGEGAL